MDSFIWIILLDENFDSDTIENSLKNIKLIIDESLEKNIFKLDTESGLLKFDLSNHLLDIKQELS